MIGVSVTQKAGLSMSRKKVYQMKDIKAIPVNSEQFLQRGEARIPVDEKFFFKLVRLFYVISV